MGLVDRQVLLTPTRLQQQPNIGEGGVPGGGNVAQVRLLHVRHQVIGYGEAEKNQRNVLECHKHGEVLYRSVGQNNSGKKGTGPINAARRMPINKYRMYVQMRDISSDP